MSKWWWSHDGEERARDEEYERAMDTECVICHQAPEGPMIRYKGGEVHATCWGDLYGEDNSQPGDESETEES